MTTLQRRQFNVSVYLHDTGMNLGFKQKTQIREQEQEQILSSLGENVIWLMTISVAFSEVALKESSSLRKHPVSMKQLLLLGNDVIKGGYVGLKKNGSHI